MAKRFFYMCAGLLCLAIAFHFGATTAQSQGGSPVTGLSVSIRYDGGAGPGVYVLTPNGDLYFNALNQTGFATQTRYVGNFWGSATPSTSQESFGSVKARYRGQVEPQGVKPSTGR